MRQDKFSLHFVTPFGVVVSRAEAERIEQLELDTARAKAGEPKPRARARREGLEKLKELGENL